MDYGREYLRPLLDGKNSNSNDGNEVKPNEHVPPTNFKPEIFKMSEQTEFKDEKLKEEKPTEVFDFSGDDSDDYSDNFFDWNEIKAGIDAWETITAQSSTGVEFQRRHTLRANTHRYPPEPFQLIEVFSVPAEFAIKKCMVLWIWLQKCYQDIYTDEKLVALSLKAGLAVFLLTPLCVLKPPYNSIASIAAWAVITVDCVFESNVGLALSKGINRVVGTFTAGTLAVAINHIGPLLGAFHPFFVVLCCFGFTVILTFFKYKAPFKERWNYAVVMALITFHILVLAGYDDKKEEYFTVPLSRFAMILLGFFVVTVINISIKPAFAGDALHNLMTKNFNSAAGILERCIEEYVKGTVLPQSPLEWNKSTNGVEATLESIPRMYQSLVQSDVEVDKLLSYVPFEPPHGPFFRGYPWDLYDDINDHLRYAVFDIVGLDSCLRAEIQAPLPLRRSLSKELLIIGRQGARLLRDLGECMKTHTRVDSISSLKTAEEAALLLQHKLCKIIVSVLRSSGKFSPKLGPGGSPLIKSTNNSKAPSPGTSPPIGNGFEALNLSLIGFSENRKNEDSARERGENVGDPEPVSRQPSSQLSFMQRQHSLKDQWTETVERISALSLVKFVALVLEIVAKLKFVVASVDELATIAKFKDNFVRRVEPSALDLGNIP